MSDVWVVTRFDLADMCRIRVVILHLQAGKTSFVCYWSTKQQGCLIQRCPRVLARLA
jgi:hypothetical protein